VEAIVTAMRVHFDDANSSGISYSALAIMIGSHRGNTDRACAAGVIEALAAAMGASYAYEHATPSLHFYDGAVRILDGLLDGNDAAALRAVHAGVLDIMAREGTHSDEPAVLAAHARTLSRLQAAAQQHDTGVCAHDGCKRCAAARDAGRMCALAGCGARKRADDSGKRLLRCGACAVAAYCGPAHQRADYARHKTQCAELGAAAGEAA
jgi:hypothetical protein